MLMNPTGMTSISGYIPQFDLFIGTLTVREHLTFLVIKMAQKIGFNGLHGAFDVMALNAIIN